MDIRSFVALYKKELVSYFHSLLSYLFIVVFIVVLSWLFWQNAFLINQVTMRGFFALLPWFFLFLLPALSMRLWSEEKKQGTMETLLTLPLSDTQAALAKWMAALTFLCIALLSSLPLPITLARLGDLDVGPVIGSYIGALLLGASYLALGQLISALTKNQIIAFLSTIAIAFVFLIIGLPTVVAKTSLLGRVLYHLSTQTHFENLAKGVIDLRDVVYYASVTTLCLFLNVVALRQRHVSVQRGVRSLFVVGSLILVNIVLLPVSLRFDLTDENQYTLAAASKSMVRQLSDPVTLKLFFSAEVPQDLLAVRQDVVDVLNEYKRAGKGNVVVEVIDPTDDADAQAELRTYGIPEIQFNVLEQESFEVSTGYAGLAILFGDTNESIPVISDTQTFEYDVTAAIYKFSRTEIPEIAWLSDHGVANTSTLQNYLGQQYTVTPVTMDDLATTTAKTFVIAGPTEKFTNKEQYAIDQYVMKGNSVIVLYDGNVINTQFLQATPNTTGLEELLAKYGVTVNSDVVADFASAATVPFGGGAFTVYRSYPVWPVITADGFATDTIITAKLEALTLPWPSSITLTAQEGATASVLAQTSTLSYAYTDLVMLDPDSLFEPNESDLTSYPVAVWLRGKLKSAYTQEAVPKETDASQMVNETEQGQLVVMSNAQFVTDEFIEGGEENVLIVVNAIEVMTQDTLLSTIRSRQALNRPMRYLSDAQKAGVKYGNIASGVVIVLLLAGASFIVRKRRDRKAKQQYA